MSDTKGLTRYALGVGTFGLSEYYRVLTKGGSGSNPGAPKHLAPAGTTPGAMTKEQRTARGKLTRRYALGLEEPKISNPRVARASNLLEPEKRKVGAAGFVA